MRGESLWPETMRTGELGTTLEKRYMEVVGKEKDGFRVSAFHSNTHTRLSRSSCQQVTDFFTLRYVE